ncbi:putative sensor domain DACNV-containing protein [Pontibacter liquoris]|uniref:putative sensor domain DACNV-containing protein n=1 Tax=Pontibacter liquoris TaxID=2905677 RepID=UPI001FA80BE8|nr:hypothetical protein [Pontibacter liquoris]
MSLIRETTYLAAQAVADTIEEHFLQHLQSAREQGGEALASKPSARIIAAIIDTAFWASLRREEGYATRISLAYMPPEQTDLPLLFERRLPFSSTFLTKISPAVERPGIHLGVWHEGDELYIWGATQHVPGLCFVLDVSEPGLLVVKHRRVGGVGKFANVAILKGDQVKIVDEQSGSLPDCPTLVSTLLRFSAPAPVDDAVNVLVQLAVSMRAHKRGGLLLVVPPQSMAWHESIIHPILYAVTPAFSVLADLMRQDISEQRQSIWQGALHTAVETLAGLTAVDGATVIDENYELLAFGAKIGRKKGASPVEQILFTEPIKGNEVSILSPAQSGGTRHLAAAQFVHDQQDALAFVASQDGNFTIFAWSPCDGMVHAHRVDTLLL